MGWPEDLGTFTDNKGYVWSAEAAVAQGIATPLPPPGDPVCAIHGKRRSEHRCLYCCLCFRSLEPGECAYRPNGDREDVCVPCAEREQATTQALARAALAAGLKPAA